MNKLLLATLGLVESCLIFAVIILCLSCSPSSSLDKQPASQTMSSNLNQVYLVLRKGNILPTTLAELGLPVNQKLFSSVNSNLFVCPGTGSKPGPMSQIEEWTDYIYAGSPFADSLMNVALIISPPENHDGTSGYVLFSGGVISRLPTEKVRRLIADPFCLATNESLQNITSARQITVMSVPKRLRTYYPPGTFFSNSITKVE